MRDRYEELRAEVLLGRVASGGGGLAVFLREGMAGWIEAWSRLVAVPASRSGLVGSTPQVRASAPGSEVVTVLAAMAMSALEEV